MPRFDVARLPQSHLRFSGTPLPFEEQAASGLLAMLVKLRLCLVPTGRRRNDELNLFKIPKQLIQPFFS